MEWKHNDGGRAAAGYRGSASDCVVRSIAIATGTPYQKVYDDLFELNRAKNGRKRVGRPSSPRNGATTTATIKEYLAGLGWKFTATMGIGTGCKVHMRSDELPRGTIIVRLSGHLAAMVDGVLQDTYDCSRNGTRCVYGYYSRTT